MARLHIRLDDKRDRDIIDWLAGTANKTEAVKEAIRARIADSQNPGDCESTGIDLLSIRRVFESVLDERGAIVTGGGQGQNGDTVTPEELAKLDTMF